MGLTDTLMLQMVMSVSLYCSGPGAAIEAGFWGGSRASGECFKKVWACGHKTDNADLLPNLIHNCVSYHSSGKLQSGREGEE